MAEPITGRAFQAELTDAMQVLHSRCNHSLPTTSLPRYVPHKQRIDLEIDQILSDPQVILQIQHLHKQDLVSFLTQQFGEKMKALRAEQPKQVIPIHTPVLADILTLPLPTPSGRHAQKDDIQIRVQIYYHGEKPTCKEVVFLGSHTLVDLAASVDCQMDVIFSPYPHPILDFFYIHNHYYEREGIIGDSCIDHFLSQLDEHGISKMDSIRIRSMKDIPLADIPFTIGEPYLYHHQGICEHIIIFQEISPVPQKHLSRPIAYPLTLAQPKGLRKKCALCKDIPARFLTIDDVDAGQNPCFYCRSCLHQFHYRNGEVDRTDFKVFELKNTHYGSFAHILRPHPSS